jgi:hypothetical protein
MPTTRPLRGDAHFALLTHHLMVRNQTIKPIRSGLGRLRVLAYGRFKLGTAEKRPATGDRGHSQSEVRSGYRDSGQ